MSPNEISKLICDTLASKYDFMNNSFIRLDIEKEIVIACVESQNTAYESSIYYLENSAGYVTKADVAEILRNKIIK